VLLIRVIFSTSRAARTISFLIVVPVSSP
jgi:hypothetical protein